VNLKPSLRLILATPLIALLAACGGTAEKASEGDKTAAAEAPPAIKERQENFKGIGKSFKEIRKQLESGSADMAAIETAAADINTRAQKIEGLFPAGTSLDDGFDTEALPAIWAKPADFKRAATNLVEASAGLKTAAAAGDAATVGNSVKLMGGTCRACHDKFRKEDD
jgi:cytochrome c556